MQLSALEARIETAVREAGPGGLQQYQLLTLSTDRSLLDDAIASLVRCRRIELDRNSNRDVVLTVHPHAGGLSETCAVVLDAIKAGGSEGVDVASIVSRTKSMRIDVTKALKSLLNQRLITETRSFTNKSKKMFIAAGLIPSATLTGGVFYRCDDGEAREMDDEFVNAVRNSILRCVDNNGGEATMEQIIEVVQSQHLSRPLHASDVTMVVETMRMDGVLVRKRLFSPISDALKKEDDADDIKVKHTKEGNLSHFLYRRAVTSSPLILPLMMDSVCCVTQFPCMGCPLLSVCSSAGLGPVNVADCKYLQDWTRLE